LLGKEEPLGYGWVIIEQYGLLGQEFFHSLSVLMLHLNEFAGLRGELHGRNKENTPAILPFTLGHDSTWYGKPNSA
jgi:hypothetical protein